MWIQFWSGSTTLVNTSTMPYCVFFKYGTGIVFVFVCWQGNSFWQGPERIDGIIENARKMKRAFHMAEISRRDLALSRPPSVSNFMNGKQRWCKPSLIVWMTTLNLFEFIEWLNFKVIILTGDSDPHYSGTPESASHRSNIVEIILVPEVKEQKKYVLKFYSYI